MSIGIGFQVLRRLCEEQKIYTWQKANLCAELFNAHDLPAFLWVEKHLALHHVLPTTATLFAQFPDIAELETPETSSYYLTKLENAYAYDQINEANISSQNILKHDQDAHEQALLRLKLALDRIEARKYGADIINVGAEGAKLMLAACHAPKEEGISIYGWPYIDLQSGGVKKGDVVSLVGRPDVGKTFLTIKVALENWYIGNNVLFVSMEIAAHRLLTRSCSMYTHYPLSLIDEGLGSEAIKTFTNALNGMAQQSGMLLIVDGNFAATPHQIFALAEKHQCQTIVIDGAYLMGHRNAALDRYNRTAENVELMKRLTSNLGAATFASWQLNRDAVKKSNQKLKVDVGIEDIGYTDAIGQISSVVLGIFKPEGDEAMLKRDVKILKGRNGETGSFSVSWDFKKMNFSQLSPPVAGKEGEGTGLI